MQNSANFNHQQVFVELLKKTVPSNIGLAEEVSSVLDISTDSAYRRLRCETNLTMDETVNLCRHFDIPMDVLSSGTPNSISFKIHTLENSFGGFIGYLEALAEDIAWMAKFSESGMVYAAEDLPVFYSFFFPNLARFKIGYWNKSIQNVPEMQGTMVEDVVVPENWKEKVGIIVSNFLKVNSVEIWNEDTMKSTIRQIRFYWEAGFFKQKETAMAVIADLRNIVELIKQQSDAGKKLNFAKGTLAEGNFTLYTSDLMIGSNCVFMQAEEKTTSYIGYNSFNYMRTANAYFNEQEKNWINNLIAKSTLISTVAEKQRNQFIKELHRQVNQLEEFVKENL